MVNDVETDDTPDFSIFCTILHKSHFTVILINFAFLQNVGKLNSFTYHSKILDIFLLSTHKNHISISS